MRTRWKRAIRVTCLALALVVASSTVGTAVTWNSESKPLSITRNENTGQAHGWWTIATGSSGTRSKMTARLKKQRTNPNRPYSVYAKLYTYVNSGHCIAPEYTSCTAKYYFYASAQTGKVLDGSWRKKTASTKLSPSGDFARGHIYAKLSIPLRGDPAVGPTYTKARKY